MTNKRPFFVTVRETLTDVENVNYAAGWVTLVGAFASLGSNIYLVYGLTLTADAKEQTHLELLFIPSLSVLLLLIILTLLAFSYRRKLISLGKRNAEIARLNEQLTSGLQLNRQISKYRTLIAHAHYAFCSELRGHIKQTDPKELAFQLQQYLDTVLGNACSLFTILTGDTCAACVKVFSIDAQGTPPDGESAQSPAEFVLTFRRDPSSRQLRREIDSTSECGVYKYRDNAAFFNIIDRAEEPYYIQNDLRGLGSSYWNKNRDWQKRYNATAVVPVKPPAESAQTQCLALLCVDNTQGGFDVERCRWILEGIAVDLYYALRTFLVLGSKLERGVHHV